MSHGDRQIRFDPLSYAAPLATGVGSAALADALDIGDAGKYLLAFVLLTLTVGWLLIRWVLAAGRHGDERTAVWSDELAPSEEARTVQLPSSAGAAFQITRRRLGLDVAEARSENVAPRGPQIWLPSATAARRISFCASGSSLVVGAVAEDETTLIARVDLTAYRAVYVLLGEGDEGRKGETPVPRLAHDLVDQIVTVQWLDEMEELSRSDLEAIAASVGAAKHAGREAWARAAEKLPVGDAVRAAILDAAN
jgi:hypothetical protein